MEAGDHQDRSWSSKARAGCIDNARYWMHFGQKYSLTVLQSRSRTIDHPADNSAIDVVWTQFSSIVSIVLPPIVHEQINHRPQTITTADVGLKGTSFSCLQFQQSKVQQAFTTQSVICPDYSLRCSDVSHPENQFSTRSQIKTETTSRHPRPTSSNTLDTYQTTSSSFSITSPLGSRRAIL